MDSKTSTSTSSQGNSSSPNPTSIDTKVSVARPLYSSKLGDTKRRSSETSSPNTPSQPTVQQKVWTPANGRIPSKPLTPSKNGSATHDNVDVTSSLREGQRVRVTLNTGAEFEGVFSKSTDSSCFLRMVQPNRLPGDISNGTNKREQSSMSFQKKDISNLRTMGGTNKTDGRAQNGNMSSFRTDTAISSGKPGGERVLKRWVPDASDDFDGSLENAASGGAWDQFAENERRFGLKTDYDENIYTTAIDKSHPQYRDRLAAAERKAREIERSVASTAHVAEERMMDNAGGEDKGGDEEDKYSGVRRQEFPPLPTGRENKYTPPARRAPAGAATVKGAPVDPAIISSQLKAQPKNQASKSEGAKNSTPAAENNSSSPAPVKTPEPKTAGQPKPAEAKSAEKTATPLKPSAATSRTISPQVKEGTPSAAGPSAPTATSTVERDVLKEFKVFANQQRTNAEKQRTNKARADKEVKLIELKKFADSFKLPTPVPVDLIGIIAKDPARQKEIQDKARRDADEVAKRKAEEAVAKDKKATSTKETQPTAAPQSTSGATPSETKSAPRPTAGNSANTQSGAPSRHPGGRQSFVPPPYQTFRNDRSGQHMASNNRQQGSLAQRLRNVEQQKMAHGAGQQPLGQDMRMPPVGPANPTDPSYRRMSAMPHLGGKLNPNSHEFRPSPFAASFSPNGHPSGASSPRSAINNAPEVQAGQTPTAVALVIRKKAKGPDPKKCNIMTYVKSISPPQGRNWDDNDGVRPSYDTNPTWRFVANVEDEKPDSTMRLSYKEYFERQPFATQPTPNPQHVMPQLAHQHQLPFHLQHGAHNVAPRQSPHVPPVQMHAGQHGPAQHAPFNGADDHRMMHSNSQQSFASPRMGQVPMAYPPAMNSPAQMPYNQPVMPTFMGPGTPHMGQFQRSFSNNPQYMPQQGAPMGTPMMIQPQFMTPQGMVAAPHMQMYPGGQPQFMPPGGVPPQPMPAANGGYPSPGRPAAPMMAHQGSQQGQQMYGMSPGMQYQQPVFTPQQPGQMNNMRGYSNPGPQPYGGSPQQMHQYGGPQRNGGNNYGGKNFQGHNQHQGPQAGHAAPTGSQGRTPDGSDEAK